MYPTPFYLKNHLAVQTAFGYWPCFHDANVKHFSYEPEGAGRIDLTLHGFTMTSQTDERGYFILTNHHLVHFAFHGITEPKVDSFMGAGNILGELEFFTLQDYEAEGFFKVVIDSCIGDEHSGVFLARSGEVLKVIPCNAEGNALTG